MLITYDTLEKLPISSKVLALRPQLARTFGNHRYACNSAQSVALMEEVRNPDSKWKPYLDILPKDVSNFPLMYTQEEEKYLKGSYLSFIIPEDIKTIENVYKILCHEIEEMRQFEFKEFCAANLLACSRLFGIKIEGAKIEDQSSFVPMADMFNHGETFNCAWIFDNKN